jgi:YfiH family protein
MIRILMIEFMTVKMKNLIHMQQVHGKRIVRVGKIDSGKIVKNCDGLITSDPKVTLSIHVADCLPIFLYSPTTNSIGAVHAGWRGLYKGIIGNCTKMLGKNLTVYIGPHICRKHYEVKNDVAEKFSKYPKAIKKTGDKIYLDLAEVATEQLIKSGVKEKNIQVDRECTFEEKGLASFRRDQSNERTEYRFVVPDSP